MLATGCNIVDLAAAESRGVIVSNVPTYGTMSVAQMVFAHLLNLATRVAHHAQTVRDGRWCGAKDFCYWDFPLVELAGLTIGIVGFGRIGRAVAELATAFGMRVLAADVVRADGLPAGVCWADLDDVFALSDVVSLHCPLTDRTRRMVNRDRLARMRRGSWLINTSRGELVDENALAEALDQGRLAGAGLDVLSTEPPDRGNPLLKARNCFITPHIAWATRAARRRLLDTAVDNVRAFIAGRPTNVVTV